MKGLAQTQILQLGRYLALYQIPESSCAHALGGKLSQTISLTFLKMKYFSWYTYRGSFLNLRTSVLMMVLGVLTGVIGFMLIEDYGLGDAIYMTIITISTVGYEEVKPLSPAGQAFTAILIVLNIGIFAYAISAFTSMVVQGELFKRMHLRVINKGIRRMKDHIIVCGYGRYGREIVDHLLQHSIPMVVIERSPARVADMQAREGAIFYVEGDATEDEVLEKAQIGKARALITTLSDDTDNLFTVLSARQLNRAIQIVSSSKSPRTEEKLKMAGANYVMMPDRLGGFYMATLISKPNTVEFFSFISNEFQSEVAFEELCYEELPEHLRHRTIRELAVRQETGTNIIGFKKPDGKFVINPAPDTSLGPGCRFIAIGSPAQLEQLRQYLAVVPAQ